MGGVKATLSVALHRDESSAVYLRPLVGFFLERGAQLGDGWVQSVHQSSSKSCQRRAVHGSREESSICARPDWVHNSFLRCTPSFIATAY